MTDPAVVPADPTVTARGLTKQFGTFIAVDHLDLAIAKGEVVGFIGPNGAGKSTTIRMLCGLLRPSAGSASVAGFDVGRQPEAVREHIGYMSQKFSLYGDLTVQENLRFFAGLYHVPRREMADRMKEAITMAALDGLEAAPGARLRHSAPSARPISRRTDIGCRARGTATFLGPNP
jgi:ABC-2 type transport system ATP-binding protein